MNKIEFAIIAEYPATQDNLQRANCKEAGKLGHAYCGLCIHGVPKFIHCEECYKKEAKKCELSGVRIDLK